MAPSDDWRPYTIPYSGDGTVRPSDGTWVSSSKAHSAPLLPTHQQGSSANDPPIPSAPMDTSATAANDANGPDSGTYTAAGFAAASNGYRGPDIPSVPAQSPFTQGVHPRFAGEKTPGEGIPCAGGNPPAGSCEKRSREAENSENAPNGQVKRRE